MLQVFKMPKNKSDRSKNKSDKNWGGKRKGAGRKLLDGKKAVETTKVIRVPLAEYDHIKNGSYRELMNLALKYRSKLETTKGAKTSPRWQQMRNFLAEFDNVFLNSNHPKN